jgi:predicted dithiol-disulfide oxidoreductase (DUF899 family)
MTTTETERPKTVSRAEWLINFLDLVPKGREENGPTFGLMDWGRHHDRYDDAGLVEATGQYVLSKDFESCCSSSV